MLVFLLSMGSCDFFKSKKLFSNDEDTLLTYQKKQDSLKFVDSIRTLQNELSQVRNQHKKLLDSIKTSNVSSGSKHKFHIIAGSFKNEEYLQSYKQYLKEKGFNTQVIKNQYGFHMIAIESFDNWNSAVNTLENLRNDLHSNVWIYIKS